MFVTPWRQVTTLPFLCTPDYIPWVQGGIWRRNVNPVHFDKALLHCHGNGMAKKCLYICVCGINPLYPTHCIPLWYTRYWEDNSGTDHQSFPGRVAGYDMLAMILDNTGQYPNNYWYAICFGHSYAWTKLTVLLLYAPWYYHHDTGFIPLFLQIFPPIYWKSWLLINFFSWSPILFDGKTRGFW